MDKPNIVVLMNDHQAFYRHGWDEGVKPLRPNFDQLADEGVEFEEAYSACPLCGPVRRSMINGQYPHVHGHLYNDSAVPYNEESYLNILADHGYKNYYVGKWHAGEKPEIKAHQCEGFTDSGYGNPYKLEEYKKYCEKMNLEPAKHLVEIDFTGERLRGNFPSLKEGELYQSLTDGIFEEAAGVTVTPKESHESYFIAYSACDFLEKHVKEKTESPFCLNVHFWGPHQPFFPTQEFIDMYDPDEIQLYRSITDQLENRAEVNKTEATRLGDSSYKIICPSVFDEKRWKRALQLAYAQQTMLDDAAGVVLKRIKELGLEDNTIIIYATDHGDALGSHGGHFDKCSYLTQEVLRIPMAMKWRGRIKGGFKSKALVSNLDIPSTILDCAGLTFRQRVQSKSLLPIARGEKGTEREYFVSETAGHGYIERINGRALMCGDYKYIWYEDQMEELYNLKEDPYELINLAVNEAFINIKNEMADKLKAWRTETNDK